MPEDPEGSCVFEVFDEVEGDGDAVVFDVRQVEQAGGGIGGIGDGFAVGGALPDTGDNRPEPDVTIQAFGGFKDQGACQGFFVSYYLEAGMAAPD